MSLRAKLLLLGIAGLGGAIAYAWVVHTNREIGRREIIARDAVLAQKQAEENARIKEHEAIVANEAVAAMQRERDDLARSLSDHPIAPIRVCGPASGSGRLPAAAGPARAAGEGATARGPDTPVPAGDSPRDITAELQLVAEVGERLAAQVRAMQARETGLGDADHR